MRVTTLGSSTALLSRLQSAARALAEAEERAQTGQRVTRASDDPQSAEAILGADSSLRALDQYRRNTSHALSRLEAEEGVLTQLSDALARARQLGVQEAGSTASAQTRLVTKAEVDQLLALAVQLANQRHEGEYLFGGDFAGTAPITQSTAPFATTPITGGRQVEVGEQMRLATNHNASEVFLDTGVLAALEELSTALGNNDGPGITAALTSLDSAHGEVQALLGEIGARTQHLEVAQANLASLDGAVRARRSDLADIDLERAITDLVTRQQAYQAAMLVTSRALQMSLADYLR